jgi:hypothetical protein
MPSNETVEHQVESSASHQFIAANLTESDIINVSSIKNIDLLGQEKSRYFDTEQGMFGFSGENYERVLKLTNGLSKKRELRSILSEKYLIDAFFEWVEKCYKNEISISQDFINYLRQQADQVVKQIKISIPVLFLIIEESFRIGNITFEYYTRDFFDNCENRFKDNFEGVTPETEEGLRRFRKDYQGKVFASISLRAEKDKCVEVAKKETDKALTILRFFSPSALLPEIPSYFGRMGHVDIPSNHIFIFEDELPVIHKEIAEKSNPYWRIRRDQILEFEKYGLANANEIITKEKPTKFDDVLLNSISLFTRGIRSKDIHDKLVFTLVSLETMLLKNETEPIQSSIGLRLAFLTASSISLNIGSGQETTVNALVDAIETAAGRSINRVWNQGKSGGVQRLVADISQARELLGFRPKISLSEGLQRMLVEDARFQVGERVLA